MSRTDITAINASTISVRGVPITGSGNPTGAYTTFDELDADVVLYLNGTLIQGAPAPGQIITNYSNVNVLSGVGLANVVKYGIASTPATNAATGPIVNPISGSQIALIPLVLSGVFQVGVATSGTISGATTGSTITTNIAGITVNSAARTYSGTPTAAGLVLNAFVETLPAAVNSPNPTAVTVIASGASLAVTDPAAIQWGVTGTQTLTASNQVGSLTVSGALPSGYTSSVSGSTITLSGAPN